jgi:hypothetical protein
MKKHTYQNMVETVNSIIEKNLCVDQDKIVPTATLEVDLAAYRSDLLQIADDLKKEFNLRLKHGEMFPELITIVRAHIHQGKVTRVGLRLLKEQVPHLDLTTFEADSQVANLRTLFTLGYIYRFLADKLHLEQPSP